MERFDIAKYMMMASRRKWWIIIPFFVILLGGLAYALVTPKVYQSQTLILVQPQKVPEDYVREIVSSDVDDRLRTITQQVTSRTNLERIINEFHLYEDSAHKGLMLEEKVELFRKRIGIDIARGGRGGNAFTISFSDEDPKKAMDVANALASNFISQNLKMRESQALGTSAFLADELESMKRRLMVKEEQLKQYREKYMGGLPEQLQTNLSILERLQGELEQLQSNLRNAENRKIIVQQGIEDARKHRVSLGARLSAGPQEEDLNDLASLESRLAALEARYTERHPDVIRLRRMIEQRKKAEKEEAPPVPEGGTRRTPPNLDPALTRQLNNINMEIREIKAEIGKVRSQIKWYETKVEETPKREQELLSLNRDYSNLKQTYDSLLSRKLEAEIAVSMERKQKGEQFRVIDPAKLPGRPLKPDLRKVFLLTLVLALGAGGGLAYLREMMDSSYKTPEEIEQELDLPVLVTVPIRHTENELRHIRRKQIFAFVAVAAGFVLSAAGMIIAVKGVDTTMGFLKGVIGR